MTEPTILSFLPVCKVRNSFILISIFTSLVAAKTSFTLAQPVAFFSAVSWVMSQYLHFRKNPLMTLRFLQLFIAGYKLHKFDWQLPGSLACAIRFKHRTHSPEVTVVLWLTAGHTWKTKPLVWSIGCPCSSWLFRFSVLHSDKTVNMIIF